MFKNRLFDVLMAIAFVAAVGFTLRMSNIPNQLTPGTFDYSDYGLRHRVSAISVDATGASDYYQRHRELNLGSAAVASDWFVRHPEAFNVANAVDLSDYFQRHSEVIKPSNPDLSDWFQRH